MTYTHWPTDKQQHAHMKARQAQNLELAKRNPNENWLRDKLKATGYKWTRQATWGFRIFDFWNARLGIAIEVDGPEHDAVKDAESDERHYATSGIRVLRVRNRNEADADHVLRLIKFADSWNERRLRLGLKPIRGGDK